MCPADAETYTDPVANVGQPHDLLTEDVVAARLSISIKTLRNWRWQGRGPRFLRLGRAVRYAPAEIELWLQSCVRRSTTEAEQP